MKSLSFFWIVSVGSGSIHDRQVILELLNGTLSSEGSAGVTPSSLAQVVPLVVGGVALAAAAGGFGVGGAMGGLFTSHRNRRRSKDTSQPCESTNPLDTNDSDCLNTRWNMIVGYFPVHTKLQEWDRKLVEAEVQVEDISSRISATLTTNTEKIFGLNGTPKKPSKKDGAVAASILLTNASSELQGVSIAAISAIQNRLINTTKFVIDDIRDLKSNIATAYGGLMNSVKNATERLSKSTDKNTRKMTSEATSVLRSSVTEVSGSQKKVGKIVSRGLRDAEDSQSLLTNVTDTLGEKFKDMDSSIDVKKRGMVESDSIAAATTSDVVGKSVDAVASTSENVENSLGNKISLLSDQLRIQTKDTTARASSDWSNLKVTVSNRTNKLADAMESNITQLTVVGITGAASDTSKSLANSLVNLRSIISNRTDINSGIIQDTRKGISTVGDLVQSSALDTQSQSHSLSGTIQSESALVDGKRRSLLKDSSAVLTSQTQSLHEALGDAHTDATSSVSLSYGDKMGSVVSLLKDTGKSGVEVASKYTDLVSKVSRDSGNVDRNFETAFDKSDELSRKFQTDMDTVSLGISTESQVASRAIRDTSVSLSSNAESGESTITRSIQNIAIDERNSVFGEKKKISYQQTEALEELGKSSFASSSVRKALQDGIFKSKQLNSMIAQISNTDDDSFANMIDKLGKNDYQVAVMMKDDVDAVIKRTINGGSDLITPFGQKMKRLNSVSDRDLENVKIRYDGLSEHLDALGKQEFDSVVSATTSASRLENNMKQLDQDYANKISNSISLFDSQRVKNSQSDSLAVSSLSTAVADDSATALETMNDLLTQYVANLTKTVPELRTSDTNEIVIDSNKITAESTALSNRIEGLSFDDRFKRFSHSLESVLFNIDDSKKNFEARFKEMNNTLTRVGVSNSALLKNMSLTIAAEILRIPSLISRGLADVVAKFTIAENDLEARILTAKEKLASAQTEEERIGAVDGLVVLERLKAVQEGVASAGKILRKNILSNQSKGVGEAMRMQESMSGILEAVRTLSQQQTDPTLPIDDINLASTQLASRTGLLINTTAERLAGLQADAAVTDLRHLNLFDTQIGLQGNQSVRILDTIGRRVEERSNSSSTHLDQSRNLINSMARTASETKKIISREIDSLLSNLISDSTRMSSSVSVKDDDVVTRIALVQMAVQNFLGLWNEFSEQMDNKIRRFVHRDFDAFKTLHQTIQANLVSSERRISDAREEITATSKLVETASDDVEEYQDRFLNTVSENKEILKNAHRDSSEFVRDISEQIGELSDMAAQQRQETLKSVEQILARFD